ncbi:MAG TPA: hypothetical protein VFQ57_02085 [Sphingomonas sp.]|jgi:hypothetical protein|nr:hypothetical protein [Sphingomonas sp.]
MSEADDTPEARAEARAIRRRWISIGELVAVVGVIIAALTLWNSWHERRDAEHVRRDERRAAREADAAQRRQVGLIATDAGGDTLGFKAVACELQASDVTFPKALGVAPKFTAASHAIRADWFAKPLLTLTDGGADTREGMLPILIKSRCIGGDGPRAETAIYDIAWRTEPRVLRGRTVKLRGLVLHEQGGTAARLDALWVQEKPKR